MLLAEVLLSLVIPGTTTSKQFISIMWKWHDTSSVFMVNVVRYCHCGGNESATR